MRVLLTLAALSLCGCISVGPNHDAPSLEGVQDDYLAVGDDGLFGADPDAGLWWETAYDDARLSAIVDAARRENRTLVEILANLEAAEARTRAARRAFLPQGSTSLSYIRTNGESVRFGGGIGGANGGIGGGIGGDQDAGDGTDGGTGDFPTGAVDQDLSFYTADAQLAWEIDVFGRLRRQKQRALALFQNTDALVADTYRLVTARTISSYFDLLEARARQDVASRNLELQEQALRLTDQLFEIGEVAAFDVQRQRIQTRLTAASIARLRAAEANALSALALNVGTTVPRLLSAYPSLAPEEAFGDVPPLETALFVDDPTAMLRRRPDIRAAERNLAAATYAIGVQSAELFPQLQLTGSYDLFALEFSNLGDSPGYSWGPALSWNVFSIPQINAQVSALRAERRAALANFETVVLTALTEVDSALVGYETSLEAADLLSQANDDAGRTIVLAEARYRAGADSLLTYLDTQRTALDTQDQFIQAQFAARRARAAVHTALGN